MVRKVYKKLDRWQKKRGVIFASTLSTQRTELEGDCTHEVLESDVDKSQKIQRLTNDRFFNESYFKFNIIRR